MRKPYAHLAASIGAVLGAFGSAAAAAAAEEAGRTPHRRHLERLGIDFDAYRAIVRR